MAAIAAQHGTTISANAITEGLIRELRETLVGAQKTKPSRAQQSWQAIVNYVQENLHRPLSLGVIAGHFRLHPNHVSRLFRTIGREGFVAHLARIRMDRAAVLLAERKESIETVALSCGFTNAGYFRCVFRHFFGHSPSRYEGQ
jgi:transcriptional regulator GlxA family with amidase domain